MLACRLLQKGRHGQPSDGLAKLSTMHEIMGTQPLGRSGGMPPRKFLKIKCPNILFLEHFHY